MYGCSVHVIYNNRDAASRGNLMALKTLDADLTPLIIEFVKSLSNDFDIKVQAKGNVKSRGLSKSLYTNPFKKALHELQKYPHPITDPKTLKKVPKVGDKTIQNVIEKLRRYCNEGGYEFPQLFEAPKRKNIEDNDQESPTKIRKKRNYIPKRRSGGYAILLALYMKDKERSGLKKQEIIRFATKFCDSSFEINPANNQFYSAWDGIKMLEKHDLVLVNNRLYYLTDEGTEMAHRLKAAEDITSSPILNRHEMSFDNGLLVSSERADIVSDDIVLVEDPKDLLDSSPFRHSTNDVFEENQPMLPPSPPPRPIHDQKNRSLNGIKYAVWPIEEVDIILLIDAREVKSRIDPDFFQRRLKAIGTDCETRQLAVGDACWIARHKVSNKEAILNTICERKKMSDFLFSIYDGRYMEQKARLLKTAMSRFYYILESEEKAVFDERAIASMHSAKAQIMAGSKFILRQFDKVEDSIKFLSQLTKIIHQQYMDDNVKLLTINARSIGTQQEYGHILEMFQTEFANHKTKYECCHLYVSFDDVMGKSQMYTVKEMFLQMLMSIKGITLDKAIQIQGLFRTPLQLMEYYGDESVPESAKRTKLYELTKDQVRTKKIFQGLLQKVYESWGCGATL